MTPRNGPVPDELQRPHLVDTTVWSKVRSSAALTEWFNAAVRGDLILVCDIVALEILKGARGPRDFREQSEALVLLRSTPIDRTTLARSREVQALLADRGHHRGVAPVDLLIAASAEQAGVPLLHYDRDYDLIAEATGQPARWLVPAGSIP